MAATGPQISSLLEKMLSTDKDFRFMATNDLMAELQKDSIKLDDDIERRITKSLLKLLEDKNGEVQNLAVKCLAPLIAKAKPLQIELVVDNLCDNIDSDQERLRDVSSIALKTVVNELSVTQHAKQINLIIGKILPKLLNSLKEQKRASDSSIKIEIADILGVVVDKFGRQTDIDFSPVEDVLFLLIDRERQALRKRAITVLGYFVGIVTDATYERIVGRVLNGLKTEKNPDALRAYVLAAATISKSSTRLFANHLSEFIDLLIGFCKSSEDDELKDACVHAFEMFIIRCNKEMNTHLPAIIGICSEMIKHDPNYTYDDEDDADDTLMEVDKDDGDEDSFDEYSDDDDVSWKARRSAAKCLEALVTNKPDRLLDYYSSIAPLLLSRFKEREESVKLDVFRAFEALLKQTRLFLPENLSHLDTALYNAAFNPEGHKDSIVFSRDNLKKIFADEIDDQQRAILEALSAQIPQIVRAICKQIKSKSSTVRAQCFALLTALVRALPSALTEIFELMISPIKSSITEKSSDNSTKIDTLNFLNICFCSHEPSVFGPHLDVLIPLITSCANESFYKTSGIALTALQSLVVVLKPLTDASPELLKHVEQIYGVIVAKLQLNDIDQDVKLSAIQSAGILLSTFGYKLSHHLKSVLPILLERLRNEMTRQVTVQSLSVIVASNEPVDLSAILNELVSLSAEFLRKNQRSLRVSTLTLLSLLVAKYKQSALPVDKIALVVREIPAIIVEQDMFTSQLSLKLARDVVVNYPQAVGSLLDSIVGSCVTLIKSSLLVGRLLEFAVDLFVSIVQSSIENKPQFTDLMSDLTAPVYTEKSSRQVCLSVALILANSLKANDDSKTNAQLLQTLVDLLKKSSKNESCQMFALYALGEIGRIYPQAFDSAKVAPDTIIMQHFASSVEEIKTVACYSLGALGAGNVSKYLPVLLKEIKKEAKQQYLLLHALKEVINSQGTQNGVSDVFRNVIDDIWTVLLSYSKAPEESIRSVVSECLGKLAVIEPAKFVPQLIELSKASDSLKRGCAVAGARVIIVASNPVAEQYLHNNLGQLLSAIKDEDLSVRRIAIMTLNSAAHNKPRWIKELLPDLLPSLYHETAVNKELIKEIEMGPFKYSVDSGLDLRKATFECLYCLMENCLDRIDPQEFMNYVEEGLKDVHDIALLNLLMVTRLSQSCTTQMAQRIDGFCDLIMPLLSAKPRANSVKQENDKLDELKRACIRTIVSLKKLYRSPKLTSLVDFINADTNLKEMIKDAETQ